MKHILTTLLLFIGLQGVGQVYTDLLYRASPSDGYGLYIDKTTEVVSKYDTTVIYKGADNCSHKFASKAQPNGLYSGFTMSCDVLHDAAGCPDKWLNEKQICTKCLRHMQIKEDRTVKELPPPKDEYQEALDRLSKKLQFDTKGNIIKQ